MSKVNSVTGEHTPLVGASIGIIVNWSEIQNQLTAMTGPMQSTRPSIGLGIFRTIRTRFSENSGCQESHHIPNA